MAGRILPYSRDKKPLPSVLTAFSPLNVSLMRSPLLRLQRQNKNGNDMNVLRSVRRSAHAPWTHAMQRPCNSTIDATTSPLLGSSVVLAGGIADHKVAAEQ